MSLPRFDFIGSAAIFIENLPPAIRTPYFGRGVFIFNFLSAIKTNIVHFLPLDGIGLAGKFRIALGAVPNAHGYSFDSFFAAVRTGMLRMLLYLNLGKANLYFSSVSRTKSSCWHGRVEMRFEWGCPDSNRGSMVPNH